MKKTLLLLTLAALGLAGSVSAAVTLNNGNFEAGTDPGVFAELSAGSLNISNWTVGLEGVDYIGTYWKAFDGVKSVDLNKTAAGSVSQIIATEVGKRYEVTFYMSGNPDGTERTAGDPLYSPSNKTLSVTADGGSSASFSFNTATEENTKEVMGWKKMMYSFTATEAETTLAFTSTTVGAFGPALDNVSIEVDLDADNDGVLDDRDCNIVGLPDNTKACTLWESGVRGKGILTAPGLQKKPFNEKAHAGKKNLGADNDEEIKEAKIKPLKANNGRGQNKNR